MLDFFIGLFQTHGFLVGLYSSALLVFGAAIFLSNFAAAFVGVPRHVRAAFFRQQAFGWVCIATVILSPLAVKLYWNAWRGLALDAGSRWGFR